MFRQTFSQIMLSLIDTRPASAMLGLCEHRDSDRNVLRVLTWHRVDRPDENPHLYDGVHSATPEAFQTQIQMLSQRFQFVSTDQVVRAIQGDEPLPPRAVLITFDDAYAGFQDYAWPILKRYRAPVILFVPTSFPDHPERRFWWDQIHWSISTTTKSSLQTTANVLPLQTKSQRAKAASIVMAEIKSLPHDQAMAYVAHVQDELQVAAVPNNILSWRELQQLAADGVTLGAHTHTHPMLNRISLEAARKEVVRSRNEIEQHTGIRVNTFAYPAGGYREELAQMLAEESFDLAFTTERGLNVIGACNPLLLQRINVGRRSSLNVLRVQMHGWMRKRRQLKNG